MPIDPLALLAMVFDDLGYLHVLVLLTQVLHLDLHFTLLLRLVVDDCFGLVIVGGLLHGLLHQALFVCLAHALIDSLAQ